MGTISLPTVSFSGQSSYAADLQNELNRALQIASLPIQLMQANVSTLQSQEQALTGLQSVFGSLQGVLQSIDSATSGSLSASVSQPAVLTAAAGAGALPGTYTIQVDNIGTPTTTLSVAGQSPVTDPSSGSISSSSTFTLTVNGVDYTITPSDDNLNALAAAINSSGAGVEANVVNVGGSSGADYRLSIVSGSVGDTAIQLNDGTTDLLNTVSAGTDAKYSVDGSNIEADSTTNQVTLAPGLTVNLLETSTSPVTITVGTNYNALSNALSNFANAYNSAVSTLNQQIGQNAGPLAGQSIIYSLTGALNSMVNYTDGLGAVNSLASIGFTLSSTGQLSFDPTVFNNLSISDIQQFLGGLSSGGFLEAAGNALTPVADPTTGAIQSEFTSLQNQVTNENTLIANEETRVTDMQTNLEQQLSAADALIANLEAQKTYYTELFQAQYPSSTATG